MAGEVVMLEWFSDLAIDDSAVKQETCLVDEVTED